MVRSRQRALTHWLLRVQDGMRWKWAVVIATTVIAGAVPPSSAQAVCGSQAEMTVRKVVVNPAGDLDAARQFQFTPDPKAPWLLPGEQTQGFFELAHDTERTRCTDSTTQDYTVTEDADPFYNTTSSCTGDLPPPPQMDPRTSSAGGSSVTFRPGPTQGEVLVCTFTNTRKTGTLRVEKALDPTSDPGKFDLQIDGVTELANAGHGQGVTRTVETGTHSVGELAGMGTRLSDYSSGIDCRDAEGGVVKSGTGTSLSDIAVGEGDQITCTITNKQATAKLTVVKATAPASSGDDQFDFTTTGQSAYKLDTDGDNTDGAKASETFSYADFGEKVIHESALPVGWDLTNIACVGTTAEFSNDGTNFHASYAAGDDRARVTLVVGDDVTCTFTNTRMVADLSLAMAGSSSAGTRSQMTYALTVENHGPTMAKNAVLTDMLPYGTRYIGATPSQGSCTLPGDDIALVTCELGDIASGANATILLTVKVTARPGDGFLNNLASVANDTPDPDTGNNSPFLSTTVTK